MVWKCRWRTAFITSGRVSLSRWRNSRGSVGVSHGFGYKIMIQTESISVFLEMMCRIIHKR
jgi:hypothetical protein